MRFLLFPLTLLYHFITGLRNLLYDISIFKSTSFPIPIIGIGNLKVGGTGKTPHTEYVLRLLMEQFSAPNSIAVLSRGYGRSTKGYLLANAESSPDLIGDEPFQYYWKWSDKIKVAVCERRVAGVERLLQEFPGLSSIVLDDAFQHRAIKPGLQIMLTEYGDPFYNDYILPVGRLREARRGAQRADIIILSKSPAELSLVAMEERKRQIMAYNPKADVYFTTVQYGQPVLLRGNAEFHISRPLVLVTGIAKAAGLKRDLQAMNFKIVEHLEFNDHYIYRESDVLDIKKACNKHEAVVLCTEKDAVKLKNLIPEDLSTYYIPIEVLFLEDKQLFNNRIIQFIGKK